MLSLVIPINKITILTARIVRNIQLYFFGLFTQSHSFVKPANKKQVLFSKSFLLKKSITNKPAFFIWFAKIYFHFHLLIYFHYSCIINSQKLVKSCYLCNLTRFPFCLFLSDKVIYRVTTFFLHYQTSHCFKSYFSKC